MVYEFKFIKKKTTELKRQQLMGFFKMGGKDHEDKEVVAQEGTKRNWGKKETEDSLPPRHPPNAKANTIGFKSMQTSCESASSTITGI